MSAPIVPGDAVRTGTGNVRVVSRVFTTMQGVTTYALHPLTGATGRARRSYAECVTLVRTAELRRFYELLDLARLRDVNAGGVPAGGGALILAAQKLTAARERGLDGPGELAAAARSLRMMRDARS